MAPPPRLNFKDSSTLPVYLSCQCERNGRSQSNRILEHAVELIPMDYSDFSQKTATRAMIRWRPWLVRGGPPECILPIGVMSSPSLLSPPLSSLALGRSTRMPRIGQVQARLMKSGAGFTSTYVGARLLLKDMCAGFSEMSTF